jgi:hypothetical protein
MNADHAEVSINEIIEVFHNLIRVFVKKSLQLRHFLIVIEVFLVLCIELVENLKVVLQSQYQLLSSFLLRQIRRLLELAVLLD